MAFSCIQAVYASDNTMQIAFEDVTGDAETLAGEAKIKVSIKGVDGNISASQMKFTFSGNGSYKSIAYSEKIRELTDSSDGGQPFFVQLIDAKSANSSKSFDIAFSGGAKHSLPVSASGTEIAVITFSGEPNEEITLATGDLENSFCVMAPNITEPKNHVASSNDITVKFSDTTNTGVKLTVNANLDELSASGGFADASDVKLEVKNLKSNQVRTFKLSEANKTGAVSYKFEIDKLAAGKYDISLVADGFVSSALSNVDLTADKQVDITSDNFYAGDVNADGKLTLLDYNRFISMYGGSAAAYDGIDYNRDNKLTQYDLLAFITSAEKHIENGKKGTVPATLTATSSATSVQAGDTFTVTLSLDAGENDVNSYYINASYPNTVATLTKAECTESKAENKAVNIAKDGKIQILNKVSDAAKKEIYKFTFKAAANGTFTLSFNNAEGAMLYDVSGEASDNLLNVTAASLSVTVGTASGGSDGAGGGGGGGAGGGGGGGGSSSGGYAIGGSVSTSTSTANTHNAFLSGYDDNTIRPNNNITRAEAAALIARISADFSADKAYDVSMFSDIADGDWYAKNVGYAAESNIVSGYSDGTFKPGNTITREEFAAMICRFMKYDTDTSELFSDVPSDSWAAPYISAMKVNGIISGYSDGSFGMGKNITRAETVVIINRILGRTPNDEKVNAYVSSNGCPATDIEGHWAFSQLVEATVTHNADVMH